MEKKPALVGTEILTFTEGDAWIAGWTRYDIVAQGNTEVEAVDRLFQGIAGQCIIEAMHGERPLENAKPPPEHVLECWKKSYQESHPGVEHEGD